MTAPAGRAAFLRSFRPPLNASVSTRRPLRRVGRAPPLAGRRRLSACHSHDDESVCELRSFPRHLDRRLAIWDSVMTTDPAARARSAPVLSTVHTLRPPSRTPMAPGPRSGAAAALSGAWVSDFDCLSVAVTGLRSAREPESGGGSGRGNWRRTAKNWWQRSLITKPVCPDSDTAPAAAAPRC